jgi:hypothetical protein
VNREKCPCVEGKLDFGNKGTHTIYTTLIHKSLNQGLFLSLEEIIAECLAPVSEILIEGFDVTSLLNLAKCEDTADNGKGEEAAKSSNALTGFVSVFSLGLSKTDKPRAQSSLFLVKQLKNSAYFITKKVDDCSVTIGYNSRKQRLQVYFHNFLVPKEETKKDMIYYWTIAHQYNLEAILSKSENVNIVI